MNFLRVNIGSVAIASVMAVMSSCSGHGGHEVEYVPMDSVPFNVETNSAARSYVTRVYPNVVMFRVEYPQYDAVVRYGMVHGADSATLAKAYEGQLGRMGESVYDSNFEMEKISGDEIDGWIFTSLPDKFPLQMIVTDSTSMMLHGKLSFTKPITDTAGIMNPAVKAVAADMRHMADRLNLSK